MKNHPIYSLSAIAAFEADSATAAAPRMDRAPPQSGNTIDGQKKSLIGSPQPRSPHRRTIRRPTFLRMKSSRTCNKKASVAGGELPAAQFSAHFRQRIGMLRIVGQIVELIRIGLCIVKFLRGPALFSVGKRTR